MDNHINPPGSLRARMKEQTRDLIVDTALEAMASGDPDAMTHDAIAKRVGVSRQTVYRYFADREALLQALWARITERAGPQVAMPTTEAEMIEAIRDNFVGFDAIADVMTVAMSTPQGRAMRNSMTEERRKNYTAAAAEAVAGLPERDQTMVTGLCQLLSSGYAWLEMRQQWDLTGDEIADACQWAVQVLLADVRNRKGMPLRDDVASQLH